MSSKVEEVVRDAEELGADAKDIISEILKQDKIGVMEQAEEKQSAEYLEIQLLVDGMMSAEGLKIEMHRNGQGEVDMDDFVKNNRTIRLLRTNRELVRYELKKRGVDRVSYVGNRISGVFTIQTGRFSFEMPAWKALCDDRLSKIRSDISDSVDCFLRAILGKNHDCVDVKKDVNQALSYKDIWDVMRTVNLHYADMLDFSKHEWDIYFAFQAVISNAIYHDADIAVETVRVKEYLQNYEDILNVLNNASNLSVCRNGYMWYLSQLGKYDSFGELISQMADVAMEGWLPDDYGKAWGMESI